MTTEQLTTWTLFASSLLTTLAWLKAQRDAAHAQASLKIWRGVAMAAVAALALAMLKKKSDNEGGQS